MGCQWMDAHPLERGSGDRRRNDVARGCGKSHAEDNGGDHAEDEGGPEFSSSEHDEVHGNHLAQPRHPHGTDDEAHNGAGYPHRGSALCSSIQSLYDFPYSHSGGPLQGRDQDNAKRPRKAE